MNPHFTATDVLTEARNVTGFDEFRSEYFVDGRARTDCCGAGQRSSRRNSAPCT